MSDVTAIHNLVEKHKALREEIAKVIIGQQEVVRSNSIINLFRRAFIVNWCSWFG